MKKVTLLATVLLTACLQIKAQTLATEYKGTASGNPISGSVFCADPTAIEYDGRLYVYGTNDHQQYIKNGKTGSNGYGNIKSLVVFSTDDMVNWTFHGTIDVGKVCTWAGQSWAPSAVWREKENSNGTKTNEFYIYFANGGGSVGVMRSLKSPLGPFSSPLSQAMIRHGMAGVDPCNWLFDPGVVIDSTGTGWIAFGGGDPQSSGSKLWPGNSRIAKLKSTMTALDGAAVNMPAPYLFEASELNIIGGRFVYTYNTSWGDRPNWNTYEKRDGQAAPSACSMCYMVTDTPLDPDSWEYRGEYVPNEGSFSNLGADYGNNHTHLHKFNGKYYLFYHGNVLEKTMKSKNAMNSGASGYRSLCVNELTVNEKTQKLNKVSMNKSGTTAIKNMNPYTLQQAETMSTSGGVNYEDFKNIKSVSKSSLGNDASENLYVKMAAGAWTMVRKVDFGTNGASQFTLRAKGTGKMEIRIDGKTKAAAATVEFSSTTFQDFSIDLDPALFKKVHHLYFVFTESTNAQFDSWQFAEYDPTGVFEIKTTAHPQAEKQFFDLSGRRLPKDSKHRGLVIEQYTDENGVKKIRKHF
jgi:arabinoxylan arabinofuranohydrolase